MKSLTSNLGTYIKNLILIANDNNSAACNTVSVPTVKEEEET